MAADKIIAGLEDALAYANCKHDFIVIRIEQVLGSVRVSSRCDKCASVTTQYMPAGSVQFFTIERER